MVTRGTDSTWSNNSLNLCIKIRFTALNLKTNAVDAFSSPPHPLLNWERLMEPALLDWILVLVACKLAKLQTSSLLAVQPWLANPLCSILTLQSSKTADGNDVRNVLSAGNVLFKDEQYCAVDFQSVFATGKSLA